MKGHWKHDHSPRIMVNQLTPMLGGYRESFDLWSCIIVNWFTITRDQGVVKPKQSSSCSSESFRNNARRITVNILPFHLAFCVWIHHNTWSRIEVLMDRHALSGESNHHDARLNGRGQKVAENTKHSSTIESIHYNARWRATEKPIILLALWWIAWHQCTVAIKHPPTFALALSWIDSQ